MHTLQREGAQYFLEPVGGVHEKWATEVGARDWVAGNRGWNQPYMVPG